MKGFWTFWEICVEFNKALQMLTPDECFKYSGS